MDTKFGGGMSPPDGGKFARCLGAFIMNCGILEFHTYSWMSALSPNFELPASAPDMSWADRVAWIRKILKSAQVTDALRQETFKTLDSVRSMYELRNIVAHGPLLWGRFEDGSLFGFVPNVRKSMKGKPSKTVKFGDIELAISTIADLYRRLKDLLDRVGADMGLQAPPSPGSISDEGIQTS